MPANRATPLPQDYRAVFEASSDGLVINDAETGVVLEANPAFCRMHGYDHMAGLHPTQFIHPDSHPVFAAYFEAVRNGKEFRTRARDVRRDGTVFDVEVLGRGFSYQGRFALLGVVRDVTEQVRAYQDLEERVVARTREIERRRQVAETLRHLLTVVNTKRTLEEILDAIVGQAARLLGSDAEALYLLDEQDPSILRLQASRNLPRGAEPSTVAKGTPIMGLAAERKRPVVAADLRKIVSEPFAATVDEQVQDRGSYLELVCRGPAASAEPRLEQGNRRMAESFRSLLAVPLLAHGNSHGSLTLAYRALHVPSEEELELIDAFAAQAALAIENARLHAESEQRRQELEALYQADQALHRSLKLDQVLEVLVDLPVSLGRAEIVSLLLWDERRQRFVFGAARGLSEAILQDSFSLAEARIARRSSSEIVEVQDAETDPRLSDPLRSTITREGVRAWISSPIRIGGHLFGSFSFGYGHPHTFTDRERRLLVALAQRAGLAIQNARLHEESELQRQELAALYEADEALHRSLHLRDVLDALVDAAMGLLHVDCAGLWGPDTEHAERMVPLVSRGLSREYLQESMRLSDDPDVVEYWWAETTFAVEDVLMDPRVPPSQRGALEREGYRGLLSIQIRVGDDVFGSFTVGRRTPHRYDDTERRLLTALAQRAGLAIQNARLFEQAQQAATLEERQRLARELHDAVTQTLFSTALIAEVLPQVWEADAAEGRQRLTELRRLTRGALAEMRTLLVELRPGALTELPLAELVRQLAEATAGRTRLEVTAAIDGTPRALPAAVQVALYRMAQEALNNVVKHAQARHARFTLRHEANDSVHLQLDDDGRGFDPSAIPPGHLGVGIMRERAAAIGAHFQITSCPGTGTSIEVHWRGADPDVLPLGSEVARR